MKNCSKKLTGWNRILPLSYLVLFSLVLFWTNLQVESKQGKTKDVRIICRPNTNLTYSFKTTTLIGNGGRVSNKKVSSGNLETKLSGEFVLSCPSRQTNQESTKFDKQFKNKNIILLTFNQVSFLQFQGYSKGFENRKYRRLITSKDLTKQLSELPIVFIQSQSGHIQKMIFKKSETRYIRSLKKGILRLLTTETIRSSRSQTDGVLGKYRQQYHKSLDLENQTLQIYQKFSQDDFISILPPSKRHLHYEGAHLVRVSLKEKVIRKAGLRLKISFGQSKKVHHAFKEFERISQKDVKNDLIDKNDQENHSLETLFVGSIKLKQVKKTSDSLKQDISQLILNLEQNGRNSNLGSQFQFENSFMVNKFDKKSQKQMNRRKFSKKFFKRLLNSVKKDPSLSRNASSMLSALAKYGRLHPIQSGKILLGELKKGVDELMKSNNLSEKQKVSIKNYLESVQNLVASVRSKEIQEKLVKISTLHPYLANNYIYASVVIRNPPKSAFSFLKLLKSKGLKGLSNKKFKISSEMNENVQKNAFMAYADLAHRIKDKSIQEHIVKEILSKISKATEYRELETFIHALNNAGQGVDLTIIKSFLKDKKVPDAIKVLVVENLKKRKRKDENVDDLIHSMVSHKKLSNVVKTSLINAQIEREKHLKSGISVDHFADIHKKSKSDGIKAAIRNYLYTVGSKKSGEHLSKAMKLKKVSAHSNKKVSSNVQSNALFSHEDLALLEEFSDLEAVETLKAKKQSKPRKASRPNKPNQRNKPRKTNKVKAFFSKVGSKIKRAAKGAARGISRAARKVGSGIKGAARKVASGVKKAANKVKQVAVKGAKAIKKGVQKAAKWVKEKAQQALNAVKKIVDKVRNYFSGEATYKNEQACIPVSVNSQMCLREASMIEFIRKQGDMSTIKKAKHFSFEALVGCQSANIYSGFLVYAGASFECSADKSGMDLLLLAKAKVTATLFRKEFVVIEGSAELTKRGEDPLNDNIYLKVFETTFVNRQFVPEKIRRIIDSCFSDTKPILEKRYPELFKYETQVMAGVVPLTFHFNAALNLGVELKYGLCLAKLEASSSLEPYVSLEVSGSASVGIPGAKAGVRLGITFAYRIIPRIAFEKCNLCASLQQKLEGVKFDIGLSFTIMKWTKTWNFYTKQLKPYVKTLFEKCVNPKGFKPSSNDSPLQFTNKRDEEENPQSPTNENSSETNPEEGFSSENAPITKQVATEGPSQLRRKIGSGFLKSATNYKPLFGPNAEKIAISGGKPPKPNKQTMRSPITAQQTAVWSIAFLNKNVPASAVKEIGIEKLRRLPNEYFQLKSEDRANIPNEVLLLPTSDLVKFIEKLPARYKQESQVEIPQNAQTKGWSSEDLQQRIPAQVYENVPLRYLRHLHPEILQIRERVLTEIPTQVYSNGNKGIVGWVCQKYEKLCKELVDSIQKNENVDYSELMSQEENNSSRSGTSHNTRRNHFANNNYSRRPTVELDIRIP